MSGRKCEYCYEKKEGHCPFDHVCNYEPWENFPLSKRVSVPVPVEKSVFCGGVYV